jgi:hypothetical protein
MKPHCDYCGLKSWTRMDTRCGLTCPSCARFIESVSYAEKIKPRARAQAVDDFLWGNLRSALARVDDVPHEDPFAGIS